MAPLASLPIAAPEMTMAATAEGLIVRQGIAEVTFTRGMLNTFAPKEILALARHSFRVLKARSLPAAKHSLVDSLLD